MAKIAFAVDHEEGHVLSTFKLARQLMDRGHAVTYLGLEDSAPLVTRQGFDFVPILSQAFPRGSVSRWRNEALQSGGGLEEDGEATAHAFYDQYLGTLARGDGLDGPVRSVQPDLFLANSIMAINAVVLHYRFDLPVVLLTPHLRMITRQQRIDGLEGAMVRMRTGIIALSELVRRKNPAARRLRDITAPLFQMPELVQCPREFDRLPDSPEESEPGVYYIEPSLDLSRRDDRDFPWERLDPAKKLLYVSLGSQGHLAGRQTAGSFLRAVAEGAARRPEWQLVLSTGGVAEAADLPLPADALAFPWIPQIPVLERSTLMVNHGGTGTVKECIFLNVPMVSYPIGRDQPETVRRVVHHGLGLGGELAGATADGIFSLIEQVDREPRFRDNVARMSRCFHEAEAAELGVSVIEETLERSAVRSSAGG
jgi:zeaxanthin glucosyltransferase